MTAGKKSRFAGVTWDEDKGLWNAYAKVNGYAQPLGWYSTEEQAAEAIWVRLGHSGVRDADGTDIEQDQRWEMVAGSDFLPDESFLPTRSRIPGVVPGRAVRVAASPSDPVSVPSLAGSSSKP